MYRSREHKIIAGVCGGLAEKWHMPPTLVRLIFILSCILPGPQIIIYLVMWMMIPKAPAGASYGRY
ncbi:PspC domain-containing protein [Sphaerisporangium sp. B11E5]|uniref:PspC domain-containing protein n=1 Tax=Sphaerisporangium sp. B11E5 TaxID=3153563 RepID=UPI00325E0B19